MDAYRNLIKVLRKRGIIDEDTPCETKEEAIMYALAYIIEESI